MNFEIVPTSDGYLARIVNGDKEVIFVSTPCESKAQAKSLIALVANAAENADIDDRS